MRGISSDAVDPADLVYEGADPGIDGAMVFVDDQYVSSTDELSEIMARRRRDFKVLLVLTQVKTSQTWSKQQADAFSAASVDIFRERPNQPISDYLKNFREIFFALFQNLGRIEGGRPHIACYFATSAPAPNMPEVLGAFSSGRDALVGLDYFQSVAFEPLDRDRVHQAWAIAEGSAEAQLPTIGYTSFPKSPGIHASYVATVRAVDYVKTVLKDEHGAPRSRIFEENVRDFLGADAEVNAEILATISDPEKQKWFGVMNNGVTIVANDVRVQGTEIYMRDFQIVNGCQTSNVLSVADGEIGDDVSLMVKVIHADQPDIVDEIVRSTNRQSKVEDEQFLSTMKVMKGIENYFEARGKDDPQRLYFERRKSQYARGNIPAIRVFDIREAARSVSATFLDKPDLASRYPNKLTSTDLRDVVFNPDAKEEIFYTACYCLYRLKLLIGNKKIDQRYSKLRWHILMAARLYVADGKSVPLNSPKIHKVCEGLISLFAESEAPNFDRLRSLLDAVLPDTTVSRDLLKSQPFTQTVRLNVANYVGPADPDGVA